jgi:hypothetical protein
MSADEPSGVHTSTVTTTQSGYVPPHIRAINRGSSGASDRSQLQSKNLIDIDVDAKTESYASNPYEDAWSSNDTLGPWSAVDTRRRNALYEPQRSVKEITPPAPAPIPTAAGPSTRGNWVKSVSFKICQDYKYVWKLISSTRLVCECRVPSFHKLSHHTRVVVGITTVMTVKTRCSS